MKYIGRGIEYYTFNGEKRTAVINKIEFHKALRRPIFTGLSPYGNLVRLTRDEIHRFK
ncbi:hypothetical protein V1503_19275 [Bacillus sp. SCS-151]|uniref:hypothetical protein n=1 Tax=Nanhaiella sioensis TaxID=3115293 RepID=UPI003978EA8D